MNKKQLREYEQIAQRLGLATDPETGVIHGAKDGYAVLLYAPNAKAPRVLQILLAAKREQPLSADEKKTLRANCKAVTALNQRGNLLAASLRGGSLDKTIAAAAEGLDAVVDLARRSGFAACCPRCGREEPAAACDLGGNYTLLCDDCFAAAGQAAETKLQEKNARRENVVGGIVGALLGSLVGGISIIVLSRLGYVAVLSGILMGVCTTKGYELLAGKMSKKGAAISLVVMLLMTWFADRLDWAIVIASELGVGLFESYQAIGQLLALGAIDSGTYYGNLAMVYVFMLVGAIPMLWSALRSSKVAARVCRLGDSSSSAAQL